MKMKKIFFNTVFSDCGLLGINTTNWAIFYNYYIENFNIKFKKLVGENYEIINPSIIDINQYFNIDDLYCVIDDKKR